MQTPDNLAGHWTEVIMGKIKSHLKVEPPPQENHHYNRVYEKVYATLREVYAEVIAPTDEGEKDNG